MADNERVAVAAPLVAVGIMAYNEAANIGRTLESFQRQTAAARIARIVVIASGCTDDTGAIVAALAAADPRILLIEQSERAGKVVALNTFLTATREPIVVVSSADLILEPTTLEHLIAPFEDATVGMVGAHPIPTNANDTFVGFAVNLMWELHHRISSSDPKMGELVAFRNAVSALDPAMMSDEMSTEVQIREAGLRVAYAADARVHNRGPQSLREFVLQRERWCVANMQIERSHRTSVPTLKPRNIARAVASYVAQERPRVDWLIATAALEMWCRLRAALILATRRERRDEYRIWKPLASTKTVRPEES